MFMILLALGFFTIILSRENLFQKTYPIEVTFDEIMGVREGDNIYLRGVVVGRVRKILLEPQGIRLRLGLMCPLDLREDYRVEILPSSVLGGRYVYIYEGSPTAPPLPEGTPLRGTPPVDFLDSATRVVQSIRRVLEEEGLLANLRDAGQHINEITRKLAEGEGTLGRLLAEDSIYNDIAALTADLRKASDRLAAGESSLSRLLSDEGEVYANVAELTKNLREASARLNSADSLLGRLLSPDDTMYEDLRGAVQSLRNVADTVARGEGTLGRLLMQAELYDEIRMLVNELRATVDDFRETSPISTFTSIFFGAF